MQDQFHSFFAHFCESLQSMEIPFKLSYFDTGNHRAFKSLQKQDCGFSVIELECKPIRHPSIREWVVNLLNEVL